MSTQDSTTPAFVRLALTEEQNAQVRASMGVDAEAIELNVSELEERIAPISFVIRVSKSSP